MLFIIVVVGSFKLLPHLGDDNLVGKKAFKDNEKVIFSYFFFNLSYLLSYLHIEYRILGHYLILKDWEFKGIRGIIQKKLSESY